MWLVAAGMRQPTISSIPGLHRFHGFHCLPYKFWTRQGLKSIAQMGPRILPRCTSAVYLLQQFRQRLAPAVAQSSASPSCLHRRSFLVAGLLHRLPGKSSETWLSRSMLEPTTHLVKRADVQTSLGDLTSGSLSLQITEQHAYMHNPGAACKENAC